MAENLQPVVALLQSSLVPSESRKAEQSLRTAELNPGFSILLLHITASTEFPNDVRLAAALFFKNLIRRNWTDEEGNHKLPAADVQSIKTELIGLMISCPPALQSQLGEAVSIIADSDFYKRWETLIADLVQRLSSTSSATNIGVLTVAHSIFKRWRPLFRSDELFLEINHVLENFGQPYLNLLVETNTKIEANKDNKQELEGLLHTMNLLVKIFSDLSCQDLPPIFEDNLKDIMGLFHKYLTYSNPVLATEDDDEAGQIERVKAGICETLVLYSQKYEDAFGDLLPGFVESTWNLLTNTGLEPKYDILVSKALQFLTAVARSQSHAQNFNNPQVLDQLVVNVIVPNMTLRTSDEEQFEDDPIEFIRRDLEGADSDTRRRAANDFLRQLMEQFEKNVTEVASKYINHFLADYASNPITNWKSKDLALFMFTSIAVKGVITQFGVNSTNMLVDVVSFFQSNVAEDLMKPFDAIHPILKVDAIRYMYTFRSQFTKDQLKENFSVLMSHLAAQNYVIYTYTAITIERMLFLQTEGTPAFTKDEITPFAEEVLKQLFTLIERGQTPEKIAENEFLMRCVMRVLIVCRENCSQVAQLAVPHLIAITNIITKNPSNPRFNHYHFEALGAIIRFAGPQRPDLLESTLHEPFMAILRDEISEFTPYVFQLLALLLECNPKAPLPERYDSLLGPILMPSLWDTKGNVPALVRLLIALSVRSSSSIVANKQLEPMLGVFQKLLSSKSTENWGFELVEGIINSFSMEQLNPYFKQIFIILMTRLTSSKTELLVTRFIKLLYMLVARDHKGAGPDFTISTIDSVQNGIFGELYKAIILPDTQKLTKQLERKTAVIGLTKLTLNSKLLATQPYHQYWPATVRALLKLLEVPPAPVDPTGGSGIMYDQSTEADLDDLAFSVSFARLNTANKIPEDTFATQEGIVDVKKWVGQQVKAALENPESGQQIRGFMAELSDEERGVLEKYV